MLTALAGDAGGQGVSMEFSLGGEDFTPLDFTDRQQNAIRLWIREYAREFGSDETISQLCALWLPEGNAK